MIKAQGVGRAGVGLGVLRVLRHACSTADASGYFEGWMQTARAPVRHVSDIGCCAEGRRGQRVLPPQQVQRWLRGRSCWRMG